jgi:transcription initiation factor TFIID subunit 10
VPGGGGKKEAQRGVQRTGFGGGTGQGGRAVLTMEDLGCAVGEYGVSVRRGEFYR